MGDIVDIQKYKVDKLELSRINEKLANEILEKNKFNNQNIAIPIVKIAKSYGFNVYHEHFYNIGKTNIAGKIFIEFARGKESYSNKTMLVNSIYDLYEQRVVVSALLAIYLNILRKYNNHRVISSNVFSEILEYKDLYEKYEEFVLSILAPNQIFIQQGRIAKNSELPKEGIDLYLSKFFEVPLHFVKKKEKSLQKSLLASKENTP